MKRIKQLCELLLLATLLLSISSCASVFCPRKRLTIDANTNGVAIYGVRTNINSLKKEKCYIGRTPFYGKVSSSYKYFIFEKEGYESSYIKTSRKFNPVVLGDIVYPLFFVADVYKFKTYKETNYTISLNKLPEVNKIQPSTLSSSPKEVYAPASVLSEISTLSSQEKMSKKDIIKKYDSAVFMIFTSDGEGIYQGSGFFVNSNGLAISNYHNFQGTNKGAEIIKTTNGMKYKVQEVIAYSETYDYIIFRVNGSGFNYIPVSRLGYEKGDDVYAIGSPKGMENTFSAGMISAIRSGEKYPIQIDAPIDHGSSGGVLINAYGQAIGITSAGRDDSGANLNFAQDIRRIFPY